MNVYLLQASASQVQDSYSYPEQVSILDHYFASEIHVLGWLISTAHVVFQVLRFAKSWP